MIESPFLFQAMLDTYGVAVKSLKRNVPEPVPALIPTPFSKKQPPPKDTLISSNSAILRRYLGITD